MEQRSNALAMTSLKLGMAMTRLNNAKVAQFLDHSTGAFIKFPNVARMVAEWVEAGRWEDVTGLAQKAWQEAALPGWGSK